MGFFDGTELARQSTPLVVGCASCGLYRSCQSPRMPISGEGRKSILILAEAPGKREDDWGTQLVGRAGKRLEKALSGLQVDLHKDCWKINAVNCRPPRNRTPTGIEVTACRRYLLEALEEHKPQLVIPLGGVALESYLGHRWTHGGLGGITRWRGWQIPDVEMGAWVCPTYHPSYILRQHDGSIDELIWEQDLADAIGMLDAVFPRPVDLSAVELLEEDEEIVEALLDLASHPGKVSIDYETTGLKPEGHNHRILTCSITNLRDDSTIVFPVDGRERVMEALGSLLLAKYVKKVGQGIKFEHRWALQYLKVRTEGWSWDTIQTGHILDNRRKVCSLDFQAFVKFGVVDYSSHLDAFKKGHPSNDANAHNALHKVPFPELGMYNGGDTIVTGKLSTLQRALTSDEPHRREAIDLMTRGSISLAEIESTGIHVDAPYCEKQQKHLSRRINRAKEKLEESDLIKLWRKTYGDKLFKLSSNQQLSRILFQTMGVKPPKETEKGNPSVDEESLGQVDVPAVKQLLQVRSLTKARDTYIAGILREQVGGVVYPFFNLHTVRTYRSSSDSPNFQNVPNRDEEARRMVRRAYVPRPGRLLMEIDYAQQEVRVAACYHKDPTMIQYIKDPDKDMHRDMAAECYKLPQDQVSGKARYAAKNKFVFPQFYGDWWKTCSKNLWGAARGSSLKDGTPLLDHLYSVGLQDLGDFEDHIQKVEERFWGKRFHVYAQWKEDWYEAYLKTGGFEMLTGFRCSGVMGRNDVINYPVQGAAFHCLLWSLIELHKALEARGMKSLIVGQIHDSIVLDVVPEERDDLMTLAREVMVDRIRKAWPWLIVPLDIDFKVSPVDGTWFDMEEVEG